MPTRNVVLTDHQQEVIESLVRSGQYQNASEVLREGVRLIEERAARGAARLEALRDAARAGWADLDAGRYRDIEEDELDGFIADLGRQAKGRIRGA